MTNTILSSWNHFAAVFDGENFTLYRNGFALFSTPGDREHTDLSGTAVLGGTNGYGNPESSYQDLFIYNTALTAEEVEDLYLIQKYPSQ